MVPPNPPRKVDQTRRLLVSGSMLAIGRAYCLSIGIDLLVHFLGGEPAFGRVYKKTKRTPTISWVGGNP